MKDLLTIENGTRAMHTFSDAEYARRHAALFNLMQESDISAAFFTSIHNVNYYADFLYCAFGRPYGLAMYDGKVTTVSANIDGGQPGRRTVGDNLVYTDWRRDNFFRAAQQLLPTRGTIGVEMDHISADNLQKLRDALPDCEFKDISKPAMRLRMIKSDEEIAHIKQGTQVCDIGGAAVTAAVREGVCEHEVALESTRTMVREISRRFPHAELMDTWTWFQSGINTDGAHNPVTTRAVRHGDILSLNCFSMIAGYYTALERTLFYGDCDADSLRLWKINVEVHEAGLKLIRPGARCCDIAAELNKIYKSYDLLERRTFGYGHSFGVLCHYYGREAGLELREDIETILQPNMVVSMEPMIMIPEGSPGAGGYREHDILVITDNAAENITGFPYGPEHNIINA
ncbi:M24 family metallopeptidase [Candidatus Persebacteraceae bacterium Df01]|jgi:creatinase|uniref:M24 family metallopeptidase n=1 Tax=Candidatus Doriopsillibacter californiensis TaxID=2970740 RepID=A0ABT7QJN2_9GAMM|nr:M24 family metallopeptidase [Candidatus Persebacteraceae bacterium Df01]